MWDTATSDSSRVHQREVGFVLGAVVGLVGIWLLIIGLVMLGVAIAMGAEIGSIAELVERRLPEPEQRDPDQLGSDPEPLLPHAGDSPVVAEVRRALLLGRSERSVRRLAIRTAGRRQLDDEDHAMVEGLIAEAARRPIGPLPPQF
jgi:hypothetical protein